VNRQIVDLIDSKILFLDHENQFLSNLRYDINTFGLNKDNVFITSNIEEAKEKAIRKKIDVFVSDFKMPGIDGISLLEEIRNKNKSIILVLYTGFVISSFSDEARRCDKAQIKRFHKFEGVENLLQNISIYLNQGLSYQNELIKNISEDPQIILLKPLKIITDIRVINKGYHDIVKKNPAAVFNLTPRQFEEYTAELFEKRGYKVKLTPETRDGGKDLLIIQGDMLGEFLIYTECKRYAPDNPIGVRIVRELFGTIIADRATAGIIVTSSYFSPDAIVFTEKIKHQMSLVDFVKLKKWIEQIS